MKPNELRLETPYLQRNISLTREAHNLRQIAVKPFPAEQRLTLQSLQDNRATIDNIRLWDWQPLIDTYAQLQEIRTYYKLLDVDVDRYELGGSYQQVMLSARELEVARPHRIRRRPIRTIYLKTSWIFSQHRVRHSKPGVARSAQDGALS